jgi:chemotaxis signal transduction protein
VYAFPSSRVVEVIPRVIAKVLPKTAGWVLGSINYRGRLILAIDFSRLLGDDACAPRMANRMLVVQTGETAEGESELTGVLVESVIGSEWFDFGEGANHSRLAPPTAGFLTDVTRADSEMVQLVDPVKLPRPFAEPEDVSC